MRRIWLSLILLLVPWAYLKGKTSGRRKQRPAVEPVVPVPDAAKNLSVHPWVHRHHLALDPVVLLVVTAMSIMASAFFGWQTWQVNQRQMEIQATQSLPAFVADQQLVQHSEGDVVTDWLYIHNRGGLARNVTIDVDTLLTLAIRRPPGDNILIEDIALIAYAPQSITYRGNWEDEPLQLGVDGNAELLRSHLGDMAAALEGVSDLTYEVGFVEWLLTIEYQDYQGNERTEYYSFRPGIDPYTEPYQMDGSGSFLTRSPEEFQSRKAAAQRNSDHGLHPPFAINPMRFVDALLRDPRLGVQPTEPVASPSASEDFS